ncbi:MAG: PIG-L family deacetylase, partial [Bryobacterales bacterium]|nr:PIG-L family deacetylase [Bryobacterales bacterium]
RYGGIAVQDAAYLVMVPNICPETPVLRRNPVFLYMQDAFRKPYPFEPHVAVNIDPVWETKLAAMAAHQSQFGEWLPWVDDYASELPADPKAAARIAAQRYVFPITGSVRDVLTEHYGEAGETVVHAEAFEICEYGRQPSPAEIRKLFPMLP